MAPDPEGWVATAIWRACLDAEHPISVPASRHAAAAALVALGPPVPLVEWPPLCVELHETVHCWDDPARLAADLRRFADVIAL